MNCMGLLRRHIPCFSSYNSEGSFCSFLRLFPSFFSFLFFPFHFCPSGTLYCSSLPPILLSFSFHTLLPHHTLHTQHRLLPPRPPFLLFFSLSSSLLQLIRSNPYTPSSPSLPFHTHKHIAMSLEQHHANSYSNFLGDKDWAQILSSNPEAQDLLSTAIAHHDQYREEDPMKRKGNLSHLQSCKCHWRVLRVLLV